MILQDLSIDGYNRRGMMRTAFIVRTRFRLATPKEQRIGRRPRRDGK